jgi:protein SCO1/2
MSRNLILAGVGALLGLALIAAAVMARPYTYRGSLIEPAVPAQDFTLTRGDGSPFRLSDQRGKVVLLFFGYTTCPDVCPATLSEMRQVRDRLGDQADQVQFVFITVDPQRDTPERIGQYVAAFDPSFAGLSGSETELEPVWKSYWVYRAINQQDSAAGYLVDHSTRLYLIDKAGSLRLTFAFGTPVDDILQDVRHVLKQKG